MRELALHCGDPAALREIYSAHRAELEIVDGADSAHILRHQLDSPPLPGPDHDRRQAMVLGRNVLTVVENGAEDYAHSWGGSWGGFSGRWHIHPPHFAKDGWFVGDVPGDLEGIPQPSDSDRKLAKAYGQNLTLVFQPDGFDAYDLAANQKIEFRSQAWRQRFNALHDQLAQELSQRP
jgi:hypothetical protein